MPINVFIADDHQSIIDLFIASFAKKEEFNYAGKATSIEELVDRLRHKASMIDVLILDTFGTRQEFLEELKKLTDAHPDLPIIILSGTEDLQFAQQLIDGGAHGYVSKILGFEDICNSIKMVHQNPDMRVLNLPVSGAEDSDRDEIDKLLSPREKQVISLLCKGFKNNEEIAEFLSSINQQKIFPTTVQTHRRNIRLRLRDYGITNDTSLGYWIGIWKLLDGSELSSTKE